MQSCTKYCTPARIINIKAIKFSYIQLLENFRNINPSHSNDTLMPRRKTNGLHCFPYRYLLFVFFFLVKLGVRFIYTYDLIYLQNNFRNIIKLYSSNIPLWDEATRY